MSKYTLSTLRHSAEFAVVATVAMAITFCADKYFGIDLKTPLTLLLAGILGAFLKYLRVSPTSAVPDYVNAPLEKGE